MNAQLLQARRHKAHIARSHAQLKSPVIPTAYTDVELQESMCLVAFETGHAGPEHWNNLAECRNVLMWGAAHKRNEARRDGRDSTQYQAIVTLTMKVRDAMLDIVNSEQKTGRLGLNAEQRELIAACVTTSANFWHQQPACLYRECVLAVRKLNTNIVTPRSPRRAG